MDPQKNNSDTKLIIVGVAFAILLSAAALVFSLVTANQQGTAPSAGGIGAYTSTEGEYIAANGFGIGTERAFATIANVVNGLITQYEGSSAAIESEVIVPISCQASSTVFSIANPFPTATSTWTLLSFSGVGNATSTQLTVGTSTQPAANSAPVGTLVNNIQIATTTAFTTASGINTGSGPTYVSPGSNSVRSIVAPGTLYVLGFATTTATGAGSAQYAGGYTGCSGFMEVQSM